MAGSVVLTDKVISRDIEMSRAADVLDADLKCQKPWQRAAESHLICTTPRRPPFNTSALNGRRYSVSTLAENRRRPSTRLLFSTNNQPPLRLSSLFFNRVSDQLLANCVTHCSNEIFPFDGTPQGVIDQRLVSTADSGLWPAIRRHGRRDQESEH
jgi:hypothetical protein